MNATAETPPLHHPTRKAGAAQAWFLILAMFLPILAIVALAPALPTLIGHFKDVPNAQTLVPLLLVVPALCIALFGGVAGWLTDRFGRRNLMLGAMLLYGLAGLAPFAVQSYQAVLATLEQCIAQAAEIGARGIEIIGEQMVPGFPTLTDEFIDQWLGWMDKYGTTPVCHDMFLDTKRFKHRLLTPEEELESVIRDLKFAHRLGCKVMRIIVSASPELMERSIPYAEQYDVKMGIEVHSPWHLDQPWILRHLEVMERTGTKHYGLIPDFGIFTSRFPRVQRDRFLRLGVRPHIADYVCEAFEKRVMAEYIVGNVREMGATPLEMAMAENARHQIWSNPKRLLEHMPRIFHIHAKFYEMQDDYTEYSIPYDQIIPLLVEGGYDGYLSSEYEGNRHIHDAFPVDSVEQVRRQHVMFKRLLGES